MPEKWQCLNIWGCPRLSIPIFFGGLPHPSWKKQKSPCAMYPGIFPSLRDPCIETLIRIKGIDFHDLAVVHPNGRGRGVALCLSTSLLTLPWTFLLRKKQQKKRKKSRNSPFLVNGTRMEPEWNPLGQSKNSPARLIAQVACCPFRNSTSIPATVQRKA